MVKSDPRETRLKSQSEVLAQVGNGIADSTAQQGAGRGRPRSEGKGQVVSCRLPAEELHAFDALCTQLGAKSRSDGVRSVVRMASGFLEFSREDSAKLEDMVVNNRGTLNYSWFFMAKEHAFNLEVMKAHMVAETEGKIRKMPVAERKEMRDALYGYAIDIAKRLGDARDAQLLQMLPQTKLYATGLESDQLRQGREAVDRQPGAADRLKTDIVGTAVALGLSGDRIRDLRIG